MNFEEFITDLMEGLQELYGDRAEMSTSEIRKNNGTGYTGIHIVFRDTLNRLVPVIELDSLYEAYSSGRMRMKDCIQAVYQNREDYQCSEETAKLMSRLIKWEYAKDKVYPMLIATEGNGELLEELVSAQMLDLSVIYVIRTEIPDGHYAHVKITQKMLEHYQIDSDQLHSQAMENLRKDGYGFQTMEEILTGKGQKRKDRYEQRKDENFPVEMYVLTNAARFHGAAGLLDRKLLRRFAGKQNFFILPSSIHETIFIPVSDESDREFLDAMVKEVNVTQVRAEEKLSDHSYYYDAKKGEIRMCA